jgi:hypothetical protein
MKKIIVLLAALFMGGCHFCEEKTIVVVNSPNGDYVTSIYKRNCGATSRLLYHVNLRKKWSWFSSDHRGVIEEGQVFLTDTGKINITWKDNRTLLIDCEGCVGDRPPWMKNSWNEVTISYQLH